MAKKIKIKVNANAITSKGNQSTKNNTHPAKSTQSPKPVQIPIEATAKPVMHTMGLNTPNLTFKMRFEPKKG